MELFTDDKNSSMIWSMDVFNNFVKNISKKINILTYHKLSFDNDVFNIILWNNLTDILKHVDRYIKNDKNYNILNQSIYMSINSIDIDKSNNNIVSKSIEKSLNGKVLTKIIDKMFLD